MKTIHDIENKLDLQAFTYKGENIWPIIRYTLNWKLTIKRNMSCESEKVLNKLNMIKAVFFSIFDIFKLFRHYDYIIFNNVDLYRQVDGEMRNRISHKLIDSLQECRFLEIQFGYNKITTPRFKHVTQVSGYLFQVIMYCYRLLLKLEDIDKIQNTLNEESIDIDVEYCLKRYLSQYKIYSYLFSLIKPKKIIVTTYEHIAAVKSANEMTIDTIEFQHGIILNHGHYDQRHDVNSIFYPKYLCVFGTKTKEFLNRLHYIQNKDNIFVVGNYFVELFRDRRNADIRLVKKSYSKTIAVSLQWPVFKTVLDYVIKQARINKDICFFLIPRLPHDLDNYVIDEPNIKVLQGVPTYEIISNCDFHLTCYSTCAEEAPSLGTSNIFLNFKNLSQIYYGDFIKEKPYNVVIDYNESIQDAFAKFESDYNEDIINKNDVYINPNYSQSISELLNSIFVH